MVIKLYDSALSGNCHKVRMMLGFLELPYEKINTEWARGEHLADGYRQVNPRAQLPAIDDNGLIVWDSQAILVYLARQYGDEAWYPRNVVAETRTIQWLMVANEELQAIAQARVICLMKKGDAMLDFYQQKARAGLQVLESRLNSAEWLTDNRPNIADVACFPYTGLAYQGGLELNAYPGICSWIKRIKSLDNYTEMPGLEQ